MTTLNDCLLNDADIELLVGIPHPHAMPAGTPTNYLTELPAPVLAKVQAAAGLLNSSYVIDHTLYDDVYITSDIHTDLEKLNYLLSGAGLINSPGIELVHDIMPAVAAGGVLDWIKPRTLFIIIGDLVDGSRDAGRYNKDNSFGNVELLLHAYLFNLRIKARARGSEIRFTVGNHDYLTVIVPDDISEYWIKYVHFGAKYFFIDPNNLDSKGMLVQNRIFRRACLLPFYNCSPYIFLTIGTEVACVHGGLHGTAGGVPNTSLNEDLIAIQGRIDAYNISLNKFDAITDVEIDYLRDNMVGRYPNAIVKTSPLFTRSYARGNNATTCPVVYGAPYPFIVVGHCPTNYGEYTHMRQIIDTHPKYVPPPPNPWYAPRSPNQCHEGGCVVIGCDDHPGAPGPPHLAYVDIGMSSAFREYSKWAGEKDRRAEILHLVHDPWLEGPRYYNKIIREKVGGAGGIESILMWSADPIVVENLPANSLTFGGRRKSRRMRKIRRKSRTGKNGLNKSYK